MKNPKKKPNSSRSRRRFLKKSVLAAGGFTIIPSHFLKAKGETRDKEGKLIQAALVAPSDKVNLACCGIGGRGGGVIRDFANTGLANVVALCDVDMSERTGKSMEAFPQAKRFQDFRKMFDEISDEIDAVSVATPDFSHFPITILAMSLGKHVYVEKPLTRTFHEADLLMKAAKKYKVATQMGNQGHCQDNYYQFKTFVEKGIIKDVEKVTVHMNGKRRWHGWDLNMSQFPVDPEVPATFDWNTWLMTAQHHDFHKDLINGQWRCWYDFGMGALGDWGAHTMDGVHEFLNLGLPEVIDPVMIKGHNGLFFPQSTTLAFQFPKRGDMPPCTVTWYDGVDNIPMVPEGHTRIQDEEPLTPQDGMVRPTKMGAGKVIFGKDITFGGGSHGSTLSIISEQAEDMTTQLPEYHKSTTNHFSNFMLAAKGEEATLSPFEVSAPLSQVFCLGTIAQRLNTRLEFNRETQQITNNAFADALLVGPPPRKGWEEFYALV